MRKFTPTPKWLKPKEDKFIVFEGAKAPAIFGAHRFPALKRGANDFFTGLLVLLRNLLHKLNKKLYVTRSKDARPEDI